MLVSTFSMKYLSALSVLREPDQDKKVFRLALSAAVSQVVKNGMGLLGIEVPERM